MRLADEWRAGTGFAARGSPSMQASPVTPDDRNPRQILDLDPDYLAWRNEQLAKYDRDYAAWRQAQARRHDEQYLAWRRDHPSKFDPAAAKDLATWSPTPEKG